MKTNTMMKQTASQTAPKTQTTLRSVSSTSPSTSPSSPPPTPSMESPPPRPYKEIFMIEDSANGKARFTRVGVGFETRNGNWSLKLSALPVGGARLLMTEPKPRERAANDAAANAAANDDAEVTA